MYVCVWGICVFVMYSQYQFYNLILFCAAWSVARCKPRARITNSEGAKILN